ncbi:MAG: hypothetical protein KH186_07580 [Lachnospiraceae bacterium]|nr:hypothetical protein [Lachnospiraceae bacterium]
MKRKIVLMGVAAALTATALIGGSLAYFQADGQEVQQRMNTRTLSISLKDAGSGTLPEETVLFVDAMPGADLEMEHRLVVENTGDTPVYTRVTLQKVWGEYADHSFTKEFDKDSSLIRLETGDDWYIMENTDGNDETLYLYYRTPLEEGGQTAPILKGIRIAESITNEYANKGIFLDVQVDAVQVSESERARQDAILTEWGVWPEFSGAGEIISIEE